MATKPRRRRERISAQTHCLAIYTSHSRLSNEPFYHLCELQPRHVSWHVCWCGCAFTEHGVIGYQQRLDLGEKYVPKATHGPI